MPKTEDTGQERPFDVSGLMVFVIVIWVFLVTLFGL
jgi:hypothetical protein